ncbi:FeoC-like transcriptional regulator [Streptomyces sp. NPDC059009]|uniref:FeoC-like transcriptional regulator n=1 Tax=Streptomyces sp. NPDC059009 TaxID=3346694 RepID=UPI0036C6D534
MSPASGPPPSPLRQVLAEVRATQGSVRPADIAARVGVDPDEAEAMIDFWVRRGELTREEVSGGCPPAGCGGCALVQACGGGGPAARAAHRPLLLTVRPARRDQETPSLRAAPLPYTPRHGMPHQ